MTLFKVYRCIIGTNDLGLFLLFTEFRNVTEKDCNAQGDDGGGCSVVRISRWDSIYKSEKRTMWGRWGNARYWFFLKEGSRNKKVNPEIMGSQTTATYA